MVATESTKKSPSFEFKTVVTVLMALTSLWVATVVWLQSGIILDMNFAIQRSQAEAVRAFGELTRADQRVTHGLDIYSAWYEAEEQAKHAAGSASAARLAGNEQAAQISDTTEARWMQIQEQLSSHTPLLSDEFDGQYINFYEEQHRQSYLIYQRQQAYGREASVWAAKSADFRTAITLLSVTLFLFGLSLNIQNWVRNFFVGGAVVLELTSIIIVITTLRAPVHVSPEAALEHFVDGQILSNIAFVASGEDAETYTQSALSAFEAAIALDEQFADAYQWRGFTRMQSRLQNADAEINALAADDMEKAIELGNNGSVVYTNLGWAYTLAGDYDQAIDALKDAIEAEPTECTAYMNLGLALIADGQADTATQAYDQALNCLIEEPPDEQANLLASALTDLYDIGHRSPSTTGVVTTTDRFKQLSASLTLTGKLNPLPTMANIDSITFAGSIAADGEFIDMGDTFTAGVPSVYTIINFTDMISETPWMVRWYLDGEPFDAYVDEGWAGDSSGQARVQVRGAPLPSGEYIAEVYVNGNLLASETFTIQAGDTTNMDTHISSFFRVRINHPADWVAFEDHSTDNSLYISPLHDNSNFFWYTSFPWDDPDNESVLSGLMVTWYSQHPDLDYGQQGEFFLGGLDQASFMPVTYSDENGNSAAALLVAMATQGEAHMLVIQAPEEEFDQTYDLIFDPMLRSFEIAPQ